MEAIVCVTDGPVEGVIDYTIAVSESYLNAENFLLTLKSIIEQYVLQRDFQLIEWILVDLVFKIVDIIRLTRFKHSLFKVHSSDYVYSAIL